MVISRTKTKESLKCRPRPALHDRELISTEQAYELMHLFKILANDTRLRLLHLFVRSSEMCVTDLANEVGMKPQAVSNQLQRMVSLNILQSRREGNSIYYQLLDPCVSILLDRALCLLEETRIRKTKATDSGENRLKSNLLKKDSFIGSDAVAL